MLLTFHLRLHLAFPFDSPLSAMGRDSEWELWDKDWIHK